MTVPWSTALQVFTLFWKALMYVLAFVYFMHRKIHNLGIFFMWLWFLGFFKSWELLVHVCLMELSLVILHQMNDMDLIIQGNEYWKVA